MCSARQSTWRAGWDLVAACPVRPAFSSLLSSCQPCSHYTRQMDCRGSIIRSGFGNQFEVFMVGVNNLNLESGSFRKCVYLQNVRPQDHDSSPLGKLALLLKCARQNDMGFAALPAQEGQSRRVPAGVSCNDNAVIHHQSRKPDIISLVPCPNFMDVREQWAWHLVRGKETSKIAHSMFRKSGIENELHATCLTLIIYATATLTSSTSMLYTSAAAE